MLTPGSRITGLDLSVTATGASQIQAGEAGVCRIRPGALRGQPRLKSVYTQVRRYARGSDFIAVEGPSFASAQRQHLMGGMWWMVMHVLWLDGFTDANVVVVPPSALKKYATGTGNASKDEVLAAVVRRYISVPVADNNEADALVLAAMAADYHGFPIAEVPKANRQALAKWPYEPCGMEPDEPRAGNSKEARRVCLAGQP